MALNRDAIAALIPHGARCACWKRLLSFDEDCIVCRAVSHRDAAHPLRDDGVLPAICGIEYAAQAMAVHGALMDTAAGKGSTEARGRRGMLAAARDVTLNVERLDDIADDLIVSARKLIGGERTGALRVRAARRRQGARARARSGGAGAAGAGA